MSSVQATRGEFLRAAARWGLLAGLAILGGALYRRNRLSAVCPPGVACAACPRQPQCDASASRDRSRP